MKARNYYWFVLLCLSLSVAAVAQGQSNKQEPQTSASATSAATDLGIPQLRKQGSARQLIVNGSPFLVIGGELHNSSSADLAYMKPIWNRMADLNINTVLTPVSWELIEPEEGKFDFTLVDGLIQDARNNDLKLIFLWFGSWKNGMSSYIPVWVKREFNRFPRVKIKKGGIVEVLSTLAEANWQADAKAFAALMRHIRQVDAKDHTVVMIQVENEVGVLGDSRDRSALANLAFVQSVPRELTDYLQKNKEVLMPEVRKRWESSQWKTAGAWEDLFGEGPATDEIFMAWNYARYIDQVTAAGKAEYDIPMYVNAWLGAPPKTPGEYPSGGPVPHVMDVWIAGGPHLDFLSPDIYDPNIEGWCKKFNQRGNPLFIPEMQRNAAGARNVFYAIGQHDAIGVSPFAVDAIETPKDSALSHSYEALRQMAPLVLAHQGKGEMAGFVLDEDHPQVVREMGGYELEISLDELFGQKAYLGYGLVIAVGPDEFIGVGSGFCVTFRPKTPGPKLVGVGAVDEGVFHNGQWISARRLNGDENDQGRKWRFASRKIYIERCTVYRYE